MMLSGRLYYIVFVYLSVSMIAKKKLTDFDDFWSAGCVTSNKQTTRFKR